MASLTLGKRLAQRFSWRPKARPANAAPAAPAESCLLALSQRGAPPPEVAAFAAAVLRI